MSAVRIGLSRRVLARASELAEIPLEELTGPGRTMAVTTVRFAVMLVLRELGLSTSRIGAVLGGRDHSSVSHGCARARGMLADPDYAWLVEALREAARAESEAQRGEVPQAVLARFVRAEAPPALDAEEVEMARFGAKMAEGSRALAAALSSYKAVIGAAA